MATNTAPRPSSRRAREKFSPKMGAMRKKVSAPVRSQSTSSARASSDVREQRQST